MDKEDGRLYRVLNTVTTVIAQYNTVDLDLIAAKVERDGLFFFGGLWNGHWCIKWHGFQLEQQRPGIFELGIILEQGL